MSESERRNGNRDGSSESVWTSQISAGFVGVIGAIVISSLSAYLVSRRTKRDTENEYRALVIKRLGDLDNRLHEFESSHEAPVASAPAPQRGPSQQPPPQLDDKLSKCSHASNDTNQAQPSLPRPILESECFRSDINVVPPALSDDEESYVQLPHPRTILMKERVTSEPLLSSLNRQGSTVSRGLHTNASTHATSKNEVPIVLISDPGQDLDDEMMFIMARHLASLDLISLKGVIANLHPSFARARLTRGTLDLLGLHRVPVGIGSDGGDIAGKHSSEQFEQTAKSYIIAEGSESARGLESGHRLLQRLYDDAPNIEYVDIDDEDDISFQNGSRRNSEDDQELRKSTKQIIKGGLTVVITSSMKDIAIFVRDNPTLFAAKTREVIVMGGCRPLPVDITEIHSLTAEHQTMNSNVSVGSDHSPSTSHSIMAEVWSKLSEIECEPDSAHNNTFDSPASDFFYRQCQKMNVTLTVVSRYAAYAAKMPRSVYDDLALTGSSIGWRLRNSQRASIDQLWQRACSSDKESRCGLPPRCDRKWFIDTFCGGDDDPSRCCTDTAWDLVNGFMQYDTLALLAAVPVVREKYFSPFVLPPLRAAEGSDPCEDSLQKPINGSTRNRKQLHISEVTWDTVPTGTGADGPSRRRTIEGEGSEHRTQSLRSVQSAMSRSNSYHGIELATERALAHAEEDNRLLDCASRYSQSPESPVPFGRGTRNLIGLSEKDHNLKDPQLLVKLLKTGYQHGIMSNHHTQPHLILHLHLRWDNLADTLLTCLMLRSLWDMRLASVLGVVVSVSPSDSKQSKTCTPAPDNVGAQSSERRTSSSPVSNNEDDEKHDTVSELDDSSQTLFALAESIRKTLQSIGLAHVNIIIVSGSDMMDHKERSTSAFLELYESAPPIGVTLVLTSTFTSVWPFAESHPELFRDKTVRVVHTGGALIWPARCGWANLPFPDGKEDNQDDHEGFGKGDLTDEQILVPDPAAQNHRLDMESARLFYKRAQALSVPMVILSRHLAKECCIPRHFFDVLGSHGGDVGKRIYDNERESLLNLWRCSCAPVGSAARGNLPPRCDANWFATNFCDGKVASSEDDVWKSIEAVNLYSPIALLAALPGETSTYFQTLPFPVRSATHHVIGLTEEVPQRNVVNPSELRSLVIQSFLSAALANESSFPCSPPPKVSIRMANEHRRRSYHLASSVISTLSFIEEEDCEKDLWNFSEDARRELFRSVVVQTTKNAMKRRERTRRFVKKSVEVP